MNHTAALIEKNRAAMRSAINGSDVHARGLYCGIVTLLRLGAGEFEVKLKPAAVALAIMEAADKLAMQRRKQRRHK